MDVGKCLLHLLYKGWQIILTASLLIKPRTSDTDKGMRCEE